MTGAVLLLSAAVLAHEVCLLRVLSLAYWHHAAALVIAVALLGFGAAGPLLAAVPRLVRERTVYWCAAAYALLAPLGLRAAGAVDFNILEAGWEPSQWLRLLALEAIFLLPFLVAALGIQAALALRAERPGGLYAANLVGSGLGALAAPLMLYLGPPAALLRGVAAAAALAAWPRWRAGSVVVAVVAVLAGGADLPMSPFKDWPALPGKRDATTSWSPFGRVDTASSDALHVAPGLSLTAPAFPEKQEGIFLDGHLVAVRDRGDPTYLDHVVDALPRAVLGRPRVVMLGVGPGLARADLVVEADARLLRASGAPGVVARPRAWLETADEPCDLLVHALPEMHAAAETPLVTVEGLQRALARAGVAVSCALRTPPRPGLRLLATAERATPHLIAVRSADRLCVWLRRRAPTAAEKDGVVAFCHANGFDPVRPRAWAFDDPYHETRTPLAGPGDDYPFDVRPCTDARPYFFRFFRWARLGDVLDREKTPFVQWPYVALVVAFVQVLALAVLLLAGPLLVSRTARAPAALFLALGVGFMLLEMGFLQRATVRTGSAVHAAAAVLGGFLVGSGCGSLCGERWGRPLRRAALAAALLVAPAYLFLPRAPVLAGLVCAVVAFPMGMPFPAGLARLERTRVPWALAWNGCASVAAAAAAPLVSSTVSIPATLATGVALYLAVAAFAR